MNSTHHRYKKKPPVFTGPRERLSQMLVRMRQLEGNPHYIALGMAVGVFVSITPIIPLQTIVAIALAFLARGSKSAAVLGTWLSNPLTIPVVYYANYKLGCMLLGYQKTLDSIAFDSFSQLMDLGLEVTWAMIVGGVVIGAVLGAAAYFITFRIFITIRRRARQVDTDSRPRALLTAWNIQARKRLGQNFLNDPNVARAIVNKAGIAGDDVVLEIGPGLGAMTIPAAAVASRVIAVDKDGRIIDLLRTELLAADIDNVEIREADILRVDLNAIAREAGRRLVVLGNLPYNISSQVVVQLIHARSRIDRAVLMLQKEMAQRICAGPGSKDYGRLSVMLGYCAHTQVLMQVRAPLFFPAPKVDSTVIGIRFASPPPFPADDEALLFRVVKAAFGKRRKTLRNALSQSDLDLVPSTCERLLADAQIDPKRRAESLSVAEFVRLSNVIGTYW